MKTGFESILNKVKQYLVLEGDDEHIVDIYLATALSLESERPVWIMIVAPPSSGKTELISLVEKLQHFHPLHNLSARTLFSSHPAAGGGYMIREVGQKGLLVFPDFTTILSQDSKSRNPIFNQLRIIFDGCASQGSGVDTGAIREWRGKVGIIATVTEAIERIKESQSDLGERFLYYAYSPSVIEFSQLESLNKSEELKIEVGLDVFEYLNNCKEELVQVEMTKEIDEKLFTISRFIGTGRATVERDGNSRSVIYTHEPEKPFRVHKLLKSLYNALIVVNGDSDRSIKIIQKVAMSSIPKQRLLSIALTYPKDSILDLSCFVGSMNVSETKVRRVLEDLNRLEILVIEGDDKKQFFKMTNKFRIIAYSVMG